MFRLYAWDDYRAVRSLYLWRAWRGASQTFREGRACGGLWRL